MSATMNGRKGYAAVRVFDCDRHRPSSSAHARGAAGSEMGRELGRVRAWPLPGRQSVGAAGPAVCVSIRANRGEHQTFRLIVRPDIWGRQARLRLTNMFGTKAITFDDVLVGLQMGGPGLVKGTNRPVTFGGKTSVTVAPGSAVFSDGVQLGFVRDPAELAGRKLAISFHVAGESGPMTWHAKALTTSYVTAPGAGSKGKSEDEAAFPYSTASWFFLDAVEMMAPA